MIINSRKFDGSISKSWACELIERNGSLLLFRGEFDREVVHEHLGLIECGTVSYEYFWLDRWFNVFRFHEPGGTFRNYYCNVSVPPVFGENVLDYIDLDIDVIADDSGGYTVLDEDEFNRNKARLGYAIEVQRSTEAAVVELIGLIVNHEFPFDYLKSPQQNAGTFVLESSDPETVK